MNPDEKSSFESFLLAEYEHISEAHFATHEAISAFFKNYLAIVGLPLAAVPLGLRLVGNAEVVRTVAERLGILPVIAGFIVAAIGFCIMLHILNLRHDSLLYARTVNGIRNFFYARANLAATFEASVRVLPRAIDKPKYTQRSFLPTICAFGLLNGAYPAIAFVWICETRPGWEKGATCTVIWTILISLATHCLVFFTSSIFTERRHARLKD